MSGSRWIPSGGRLGCNGARSDDTEGEDRHIAVRDEECTTDAIGRVVAGRARSAHALNQRKGERSMNRKLCLTVVSSMALLSFAANAEPGHPRRIGPTREATLLGFIHQTNQNEIALAKLAQQNSSSTEVKNFADRMISDHTQADNQVVSFADSHQIVIPSLGQLQAAQAERRTERTIEANRAREIGSMDGEYAFYDVYSGRPGSSGFDFEATTQKLSSLKGADFDREYARVVVKDHQMVLDRLDK